MQAIYHIYIALKKGGVGGGVLPYDGVCRRVTPAAMQ